MRAPQRERARWALAFGLAAVAPVANVAYFAVEGSTGPVFGVVWLLASTTGPFAAGVATGFIRGGTASIALWTVLSLAVAVAVGPGCGLEMSSVPHGAASILAEVQCSLGEPSYSDTAGIVFFVGMLATGMTAVGGIVGATVRGIAASATPPD